MSLPAGSRVETLVSRAKTMISNTNGYQILSCEILPSGKNFDPENIPDETLISGTVIVLKSSKIDDKVGRFNQAFKKGVRVSYL